MLLLLQLRGLDVTSLEVLPSIATQCKYNGGGIVEFVLCPDNCNMEEV